LKKLNKITVEFKQDCGVEEVKVEEDVKPEDVKQEDVKP
jgi:hypothetical protein